MVGNEVRHFLSEYKPYSCLADEIFDKELKYIWNEHELTFTSTPGHSPGSDCILIDNRFLFTGDSLLKDIPIITRFSGGTRKIIKTLRNHF